MNFYPFKINGDTVGGGGSDILRRIPNWFN